MDFVNSVINITVNKKTFSIYYSYNKNGTFQDLLEYFAFLCPNLNICQCYHFSSVSKDKYFNIPKVSKISEYVYYLNNLILYKTENKCLHNKSNFLLFSKKDLFESAQKQQQELKTEIAKKNKDLIDWKQKYERLKKSVVGPPWNPLDEGPPKPVFTEFYDVIVHIDSIKDITKGWRIEMNNRGEENYKKYKDKELLKIGVIGNANKGKSFLLSKISKMEFPSGMSIKTEGLSIKYPELEKHKNRKIVLLDSAGLETPVLVPDENMENDKRNELFREKSREKLVTELFLQNYIINNSDILIVVVDSLSFSEQKLLLKVKKEIERSKRNIPLFIIHNLKSFTSIDQVKDYSDNTLLKSATFSLKKRIIIKTEEEDNNKGEELYYYPEEDEENKDKEKDKSQPKQLKIIHLLYANEGSEAGKFYNQFVLDFIEKSYQNILNLKPFDVIGSIKERYIEISKDIIEKTEKDEKLTLESFDNSKPLLIKLKNENEIILKKCFIDELGFSNFKSNGFEPAYNIFKNKENTNLIVRIELPGTCSMKAGFENAGEYKIIKLNGEKIKDKDPEKLEENIFNKREYGPYSLEIPLNEYEKDAIKLKENPPNIKKIDGVYILEYEIAEKPGVIIWNPEPLL